MLNTSSLPLLEPQDKNSLLYQILAHPTCGFILTNAGPFHASCTRLTIIPNHQLTSLMEESLISHMVLDLSKEQYPKMSQELEILNQKCNLERSLMQVELLSMCQRCQVSSVSPMTLSLLMVSQPG
jgi:hypothetical protein